MGDFYCLLNGQQLSGVVGIVLSVQQEQTVAQVSMLIDALHSRTECDGVIFTGPDGLLLDEEDLGKA